MSKPKRLSIGEVRRSRQQQQFVGRQDELESFERNWGFALDDERRQFVFNIFGQGGVGKSELVRRFRRIAEEHGAVCALVDESCQDILSVMSELALQLERGGAFKEFQERHKLYRQKRQEVEADPEAPKGLASMLGKTTAKVGLGMLKGTPASGLLEVIDTDAVTNYVGEMGEFITKRFRNPDDVQLVKEPVAVLSPLFLRGLDQVAEQNDVALFFDTFEKTSDFLDEWLRDLEDEKYGDLPANVVLAIAGQHELDRNKWDEFESLIRRIPLEPFSDEEAREYLSGRGITDPHVVETILTLSNRLPLLVATLAVGSPSCAQDVGDPSQTAVDRFLQWVEDAQQRQVAVEAALPRRFNRDVLAAVEGEGDEASAEHFDWLLGLPFVSQQGEGWSYHGVVRPHMTRLCRLRSPERWSELHGLLADHFEERAESLGVASERWFEDSTWQDAAVEMAYHRLCEAPSAYISHALDLFVETFSTEQFTRRLSGAILQAGADTDAANIRAWGERLVAPVPTDDGAEDTGFDIEASVPMWSALLDHRDIKEENRKKCLYYRASLHLISGQPQQAIDDVQRLFDWQPSQRQELMLLDLRAKAYFTLKKYDEVVSDCSRALQISENSPDVLFLRAAAFFNQKSFDEAIADAERMLLEDARNANALTMRGLCYSSKNDFESALADLSAALDFEPENLNALIRRADIYWNRKEYDKAVDDFSSLLALQPDHAPALASRGRNHYLAGRVDLAMDDYNRALEIAPNDLRALGYRSEAHFGMRRVQEALEDYEALKSRSAAAVHSTNYGLCLSWLGRYQEAIEAFNASLAEEPQNFSTLYNIAAATARSSGVTAARSHIQAARAALEAIGNDPPGAAAYGLGGLDALEGQNERALSSLRRALEQMPDAFYWAGHDPAWLDLRQTPAFRQLLGEFAPQEQPEATLAST